MHATEASHSTWVPASKGGHGASRVSGDPRDRGISAGLKYRDVMRRMVIVGADRPNPGCALTFSSQGVGFIQSRKDRVMSEIASVRAWVAVACLAAALGLTLGCSSEKPGGNPPPPDPLVAPAGPASPQDVLNKLPGGDEFAGGKKVYANNKCANCHKLGDTGGGIMAGALANPPPGAPVEPAPDLTKVGAAPEHTKQWLTEHIRDAKKHKQKSRMPAYPPDQLSDADLASLVEYLASRK